jgi:hypothetical protein
MLVRDFVSVLSKFGTEKHVFVTMAHMDPFYYDTSDVEAEAVTIIIDDEGMPWEICETDAQHNIIAKQEIIKG